MDEFTATLLKEWGSEGGIDDNTINIFKGNIKLVES